MTGNVRMTPQWLARQQGLNVIYYVAVERFAKVGITERLNNRLSSIQASNPHDIVLLYYEPGNYDLEAERHRLLESAHHRGEWFHREPVEMLVERLRNEAKEKLNSVADKPL